MSNLLIERLSCQEKSGIERNAETVEMRFGEILCEPGQQYTRVLFPLSGIISQVVNSNSRQSLEVGMIGNEGMLGATLTHGVGAAPLLGVVQVSGLALQVSVRQFSDLLLDSPGLHRVLHRYQYAEILKLAQTAACTRFHDVESRLICSLLMTHDRTRSDQFYLTHQALANMLGVRRSSVSIVAHSLQQRELISYVRGEITILSRRQLETEACACYRASMDNNTNLLSPG